MSTAIGSLSVQITGSSTGLSAALKDASGKIDKFNKSTGKAGGTAKIFDFNSTLAQDVQKSRVPKVARDQGSAFGSMFKVGMGAALGVGGLMAGVAGANGLASMVGEAIQLASEVEDVSLTFKVLYNDIGKSKQAMTDLRDLANKTPLTSKELIGSGTLLAGSGVDSSQLRPTLSMLGDLASVAGRPLRELVVIYNQVRAKGRLMGQETLQFAEHQININELLATSMRKSTAEIIQMTEEGKIGFPEVQRALLMATSAGGRFFGMMDEKSKTFSGMMSTLKDSWEQLLGKVGQAIIEEFDLKPLIQQLTALTTGGQEGVDKFRPVLREGAELAKNLGDSIWEMTKKSIVGIASIVDELEAMGDKFGKMKWILEFTAKFSKTNTGVAMFPLAALNNMLDANAVMPGAKGSNKAGAFRAINDIESLWKNAGGALGVGAAGGAAGAAGGKPLAELLIENQKLTADQIKRARDVAEAMDPLAKFTRELGDLTKIRQLGGFSGGRGFMDRAMDVAGLGNNSKFNFALMDAFKPLLEMGGGETQYASSAEKNSMEAAKIIRESQSESKSVQERMADALLNIKALQEAANKINGEIADAIKKNPLLQVK
jgi:tape measure domain-containing protein